MRFPLMLLATTAASLGMAGAAGAASVEVRGAVARVTVIPESRADVKVEFPATLSKASAQGPHLGQPHDHRRRPEPPDPRLPRFGRTGQRARARGGRGGLEPDAADRHPHAARGGHRRRRRGLGHRRTLGQPQARQRRLRRLDGRQRAGALRLSQAGSGDTRAGSAGDAKIRVAGSGDTTLADVRGPVQVDIAGSGDVTVASVAGPLEVHVAGSGDVTVASGKASRFDVTVAGSGDVTFGGVADNLKARIAGSGDVRAAKVTGRVSKTIMGSGAVSVGK